MRFGLSLLLLVESVSGAAIAPTKTDKGLSFQATGEAVLVPHCNGRGQITVDGVVKDSGSKGPLVIKLDDPSKTHDVRVDVNISKYEKRIACSYPPQAGAIVQTNDGLQTIKFASPSSAKGGGEAVMFVPGGHDRTVPAKVLVGVHPWNGTPWTYAAYEELLDEAGKRDVVLLMPSGLGNSLYVAEAEDEVMRAIEALGTQLKVDPQRVSIWGASMGGAGATTISFHHPDRFAFVASYFGDSKYDLTTYVKTIFGGEENAKKVNCLDVLENARWLPVFLVHGEDDHTSPIRQSIMLNDAMKAAGFNVEFERVPGMAHEGPLVVKYIRKVVAKAATSVAPLHPARVSFRSVRTQDTGAYGVSFTRTSTAMDAFVDLEKRADGIHVLSAQGVSEIALEPGALGASAQDPIVGVKVPVRWK